MKYFLNDTWIDDSTITELPEGAILITDEEWLRVVVNGEVSNGVL